MLKRRLTLQGTIDEPSIDSVENDLVAAAVGSFGVEGKLVILGPLSVLAAAVGVGLGSVVRVFNSDAAVHYVAIGDLGMLAPTSPADGIPVPPGQYVTLNSGDHMFMFSDSALVFGYKLIRDSVLEVIPDSKS